MFITFEGIEGCGKSTQSKRLVRHLNELGVPTILTLEPGGTSIGGHIRKILLDSRNQDLAPFAELFLYAADRAQHVERVIKPALDEEKWVVCDRFFDASTAYQGYARGLDMNLISTLNDWASLGIRPDITMLLDCPVNIGLERAIRRNDTSGQKGQDRFERERMDFHRAVRNGYLSIAGDNKERFIMADGTLSEDELERVIFDHIKPFIEQ
ncbi:MAG: dTMP kinase [Desulfobacterales bacterium]|nr:dTMP kinase [Desulfobacterales bacterium]